MQPPRHTPNTACHPSRGLGPGGGARPGGAGAGVAPRRPVPARTRPAASFPPPCVLCTAELPRRRTMG
eukprot:scaffold11822_cov120-Isochrysis_galbana.AAC.10